MAKCMFVTIHVDGRPPNIIARLIGLDGTSQRDGKPYEHRSNRKDSMAQQECKDEYDVLETSKVERSSYPAKKTINSKLSEVWTFGQVLECLDNENLERLAMMERLLGPLPQHMIISADLRAEKYFKRSARLDWVDHPSWVSVLEAPFVEDVNVLSPGLECFERVNADLHGLPMQLKRLNIESGANADGLMLTPSDKDVGQGFISVFEDNEVFNDESWESVYLANVLIDSGYDDANPDTFVSTCYSLDCPLDPCLFDNIEEKYSNETTSSRSKRKLLFDRINSGLFEMFHQFVDPLPWMKQPTKKVGLTRQKHGIGYELHKLLASEEKSMHEDVTQRVSDREMQWLDFGDGVDAIGTEIKKLLMDDLIVEVTNMLNMDQNSILDRARDKRMELNGME
ncbi:unnamed protein product [Camellia sinensis]